MLKSSKFTDCRRDGTSLLYRPFPNICDVTYNPGCNMITSGLSIKGHFVGKKKHNCRLFCFPDCIGPTSVSLRVKKKHADDVTPLVWLTPEMIVRWCVSRLQGIMGKRKASSAHLPVGECIAKVGLSPALFHLLTTFPSRSIQFSSSPLFPLSYRRP